VPYSLKPNVFKICFVEKLPQRVLRPELDVAAGSQRPEALSGYTSSELVVSSSDKNSHHYVPTLHIAVGTENKHVVPPHYQVSTVDNVDLVIQCEDLDQRLYRKLNSLSSLFGGPKYEWTSQVRDNFLVRHELSSALG